ncbi:Hypothetical predicted protein [Marmota monax]|uniref:Uncharacterized protein n=1 Tax=Marmota monax TaxID=9995 RepID=A0A5E4CSQ5_MARMO|nr:hypothetical protein GHT09_014294 [Marmota monax]VTJ84826.1 Hypothetical predicted protein [Marmota monax]
MVMLAFAAKKPLEHPRATEKNAGCTRAATAGRRDRTSCYRSKILARREKMQTKSIKMQSAKKTFAPKMGSGLHVVCITMVTMGCLARRAGFLVPPPTLSRASNWFFHSHSDRTSSPAFQPLTCTTVFQISTGAVQILYF